MGITLLYPPEEKEHDIDLNASLNLDIIAVHGLNGNPINTWTDPKSQKLWLRDFLPNDIPRARIMTFGYNATPAFENTVAGVDDHARDLLRCLREWREETVQIKRPIIFVGHSLGGLVIKQALIFSSTSPYYGPILQSTIGTLFFGTPHRGSSLASHATVLVRLPTALALKPTPELLTALSEGNKLLNELTEGYKKLVDIKPFEVTSFYETKRMRGMTDLVVTKESALLASLEKPCTWETPVPVSGNHREVCRFSSAKDSTYKTVIGSIRRMRQDRMGVQVKNKHYIVPHRVNSHFTGRNDIRQRLNDNLILEKYGDEKEQSRFVLHGLGGSGKTQICLKFAEECRDNFWGIFWIDASSVSTAEEGLISIARACKILPQIDSVKEFLSTKEHWLLIIDNADDIDIDISEYFPLGTKGTILITTRNPNFQKHATAGTYHVDQMEKEDAVKLLLRTSTLEIIESGEERIKARNVEAETVVEALGCLALAIVQAGAVIRQRLVSLDGFCELYSKSSKDLLELGREDSGIEEDKRSVYTTWEISIRMVEKIQEKHALLALELLRHFAFMHFTSISETIFENSVNNMKAGIDLEPNYKPISHLLEIMPSGWDQILMSQALGLLASFSLITIDDFRSISMHPLVHQWCRDRLQPEERDQAWMAAVETVSRATIWRYRAADFHMRRVLLPHIDACLSEGEDKLFIDGVNAGHRLCAAITFTMAYRENGRPNVIKLSQKSLDSVEAILPDEYFYRVAAMANLAVDLESLARYEEAMALRKKMLLLRREKRAFPGIVVNDMVDIARGYHRAGEFQKAIDVCKSAMVEFRDILSEDEGCMIDALEMIGGCQWFMDRPKEARKSLEKANNLREKKFGAGSASLALSSWLAEVYLALNQRKKALMMHEKYVNLNKDLYGSDGLATIDAIRRTEVYLYRNHRYYSIARRRARGIAAAEEAIRQFRSSEGEMTVFVLDCMEELADHYITTGWVDKGIKMQEDVVKYRIQQSGENSPKTKRAKRVLMIWRWMKAFRDVSYFWIPKRLLARGMKAW